MANISVAKGTMPEEKKAANTPTEAPVEKATETESAPVETNPEEATQTPEKAEITEEPKTEKMVPLTALQEERDKRKEAEQYAKQVTLPPELPSEEDEPSGQDGSYRQDDSYRPNFMTREEYDFREKEKTAWDEVASENPVLKEVPELKRLAEANRETSLLKEGKYLTIKESVASVLDIYKRAQAQGQKAAQESVEIQSRSQLEGSGSNVDTSKMEKNELLSKIVNPSSEYEQQEAFHNYLKKS